MNTQSRRRRHSQRHNHSSSGRTLIILLFTFIIPVILGLAALIEGASMEKPKMTTADYLSEYYPNYLGETHKKIDLETEANKLAHEAAGLPAVDCLDNDQIARILGLDPDKTDFAEGKLEAKLSTGEELTFSDKSVMIDHHYIRIGKDGAIGGVFHGYNSQHDTTISIGGEKRTVEELATIAMLIDSVESFEGNYKQIDISGKPLGVWFAVLVIYIIAEIIILFCVWFWRKITG